MTRPAQRDLVARALVVLDDAVSRCNHSGPLTGAQPGLRLALAFLFAIASDETDYPQPRNYPFVELWTAVMGLPNEMCARKPAFRGPWARTQYEAIRRRVGAVSTDCRVSALQGRMTADARKHLREVLDAARAEAAREHASLRKSRMCLIDRPSKR